jgi:hypothetical protein
LADGAIVYFHWAELLGRHAAKVFEVMSGLTPDRLEIVEADESEGPRFPLGVRVDFKGREASKAPLGGFFVCAFENLRSAGDIAAAIAAKLGTEVSSEAGQTGVDDVLGEFLNNVIGLTCSDWAEHGLETEFDPPQALVPHEGDRPAGSRCYHLTLSADGHPPVTFFLVFLPGEAGSPA